MKVIVTKDRIGALLLLAFATFYLYKSFAISLDPTAADTLFTPRTLPITLAILAVICSLVQLLIPPSQSLDSAKDNPANSPLTELFMRALNKLQWRPVLLLIVLMTGFALSFSYLGFAIASFAFLMGGFYILDERRLLLSTAIAGGLVGGMWLLLTQLFDLYLDSGDLYRLLTT